jgi:hypothetical protein
MGLDTFMVVNSAGRVQLFFDAPMAAWREARDASVETGWALLTRTGPSCTVEDVALFVDGQEQRRLMRNGIGGVHLPAQNPWRPGWNRNEGGLT